MLCKSENSTAGMMEKWNDSCTKILKMGQLEVKVGGKQMVQLEERYGAEFKGIDYSGITDIVDVVACW